MWEWVLKIGKNVTDYMQVCSLHFKKSYYILPGKLIIANIFVYLFQKIIYIFLMQY